jgi:putative signal transducing protein
MAEIPGDDVVRAITAANYAQAHIWEQALRDEGIRCQVVGDYLAAAGFGGLPVAPAEIWVHRDDLARAKEILERINAAPEEYPPQEQPA